jgi:uncharacterized pyridoxamine 5'-phosphate oxidase family protein
MREIVDFLTENTPFYVSTMDGAAPRVRPMGFVMDFHGRLVFATRKDSGKFGQLLQNPKFELSVTAKDFRWIRLTGRAAFIEDRESKEELLKLAPNLSRLAEDVDEIAVFAADEAEAVFYSFTEAPRVVKLR